MFAIAMDKVSEFRVCISGAGEGKGFGVWDSELGVKTQVLRIPFSDKLQTVDRLFYEVYSQNGYLYEEGWFREKSLLHNFQKWIIIIFVR